MDTICQKVVNKIKLNVGRGQQSLVHEIQDKDDFAVQLRKAGSRVVVVYFYTSLNCDRCKLVEPKFAEMAKDFREVIFLQINVDECQDLDDIYGISKFPTFVVYKDGLRVKDIVGTTEFELTFKSFLDHLERFTKSCHNLKSRL